MASSVNFENHIKRFIESMRGVQRVLYIGTDIDMKVMATFLNRMVIYYEKRI